MDRKVDDQFSLFEDVLEAAKDKDYKQFKIDLASFNSAYRRLNDAQQGAYHARVAQYMQACR